MLLNREVLMSELGFRPKLLFLAKMRNETNAKNQTLTNSASELMNYLEMVKTHFMLLNRSVLMSELGFMPKLRFWAKMSTKQTPKIGL